MNDTPNAAVPLGDWHTVEDTGLVAKVGPKLVYREIKAGRLRAARIGGRRGPLRIHRRWIDEWLEAAAKPVEVGRRG